MHSFETWLMRFSHTFFKPFFQINCRTLIPVVIRKFFFCKMLWDILRNYCSIVVELSSDTIAFFNNIALLLYIFHSSSRSKHRQELSDYTGICANRIKNTADLEIGRCTYSLLLFEWFLCNFGFNTMMTTTNSGVLQIYLLLLEWFGLEIVICCEQKTK